MSETNHAPMWVAEGARELHFADSHQYRSRAIEDTCPSGGLTCVLPNTQSTRCSQSGNIGLLTGSASNGLVDVDFDSPEAIWFATILLPATG